MKLTGIDITTESLQELKPDTMLVVVSDEDGKTKYIKIDNQSIADSELILRVKTDSANGRAQLRSGCYVWNGLRYVWTTPCP